MLNSEFLRSKQKHLAQKPVWCDKDSGLSVGVLQQLSPRLLLEVNSPEGKSGALDVRNLSTPSWRRG